MFNLGDKLKGKKKEAKPMATLDSSFTGGYDTDWTYTSTFPTTTTTGTIAANTITSGSWVPLTITSMGALGNTQYYSTYTTQSGPSMYRWGNQVFLNPSPKMRTLLTALQLL